MKVPGIMSKAARALAEAGINILAVDQCMRQVNMQFIVDEKDFDTALIALHRGLVESAPDTERHPAPAAAVGRRA
jgi:aspartate kinase